MSQQRAIKAKEKGNKLFKDGQFSELVQLLSESTLLNHTCCYRLKISRMVCRGKFKVISRWNRFSLLTVDALIVQAEKFDGTNPVYPSNLSAALFELGDYKGCTDAILRSWSLQPESALASKSLMSWDSQRYH
jgi:hypothetical protein